MVQLSPDTRLEGWDGCSGYHDDDRVIYGFSHTHLSGTGVSDYGDILLMPVTGRPQLDHGTADDPDSGYASRFDKSTERAEPGWYAVHLDDYGVEVQLTATERSGLHRYDFPAGRAAHVIVDLTHRDRVIDSWIRVVSDREIEGLRRSTGWARDQWVFFVARFSRPFASVELARNDSLRAGADSLRGENIKASLSFGDEGGPLLVKVGISAVDTDGARANLDREQPGWDFDAVRERARVQWNEVLGRIEVEGGSDEQRTIFTTALYHSFLAPNVFSDVDGRYRGMDQRIHHAEGRRQYTVFSLWDTFRATHPLFTLLAPERVNEFIRTFLSQYEQGGRLPVWELAANETDCMIGYHSVSVIADAYLKGIRDWDAHEALEAMVHSATLDARGLDVYQSIGFIPSDAEGESVSRTLEYAYDDWCIGRMAQSMGYEAEAARFFRRSQAWRHLFDPTTRFFRARENQRWLTPFDPRRVDFNYTEANAWQYRFFVPHDVPSLMEAMGGDEAFAAALDSLFSTTSETTGREQADITGLIGQYAHGNEPSHHIAWLYHWAGRRDLTAARVHRILTEMYRAAPDGLSGNEDCGQMSSWYVLASLGLYEPAPASSQWLCSVPLFARARIHLGNGRTLVIERNDADPARPWKLRWRGHDLQRAWLDHEELTEGGTLDFVATARLESLQRPSLRVPGRRVVPAPYVVASSDGFRDSLRLEPRCADPEATVEFIQLAPGSGGILPPWQPVTGPIVLRDSARLLLRAERDGNFSPVVPADFHRIPHDWTVQLVSTPNPQYTAGGADALIDGRRGSLKWRTGKWQGYQGEDFEAVVDLGRIERIESAGAGFLQDQGSWIFFPTEVEIAVSGDGHRYEPVARIDKRPMPRSEELSIEDLTATFEPVEARYLRIHARNYGVLPAWHPGHGGQAFIFVDEILVETSPLTDSDR